MLSVIVPAYNEETRLESFLKQLLLYKKSHSYILEIVLVNDGSTDSTLDLLNKYKQQIRIVSYKQNQGKGYAVKQGILAAQGDFICFMDADGATPTSQLADLYKALQNSDFVIGNRKTEKAWIVARQPLYRRFLSWGFNTSVDLLFSLHVGDVLCGFKGMRKKLAKQIAKEMISTRWIFDVEIIARVKQKNARIAIIPIEWSHVGGSKMGIGLNNLSMLWQLFKLRSALNKEQAMQN